MFGLFGERERKRLSWDQKWKLKCYRRWQHNFSVTQQSFRQQNLSCFSSGPLQWKKNQLKSLAHRYWLQFLYKSTENRMEWETFRLLDNGNSWQTHFVARTSPPASSKSDLKKAYEENMKNASILQIVDIYYMVVSPTVWIVCDFFHAFACK